MRIYIESVVDRDAVTLALAHNGYTVYGGKEKAKAGTKYLHYVEYWRDENAGIDHTK